MSKIETDTLGGERAFLLEKTTKLNHHVSSANTKANHHVSLSPGHPAVPGVTLWRGLPATRAGGWVRELNTSSLEMQRKPGKRRSVRGHQHYGKHLPALGSPWEGDQVPPGLPAALGSPGLQQRRQRKEGACELSKESPEPTRVVEQPALTKALVRGAGTAEEDPSEQKAHQDGTGEEEE